MPRYKIETSKHRTGKPGFCQMMVDLGVASSLREAARAYDAVTAALGAWLNTASRDLPKGLHMTCNLRDAMTVHLCWKPGAPRKDGKGRYRDRLALWVRVTGSARYHIRRRNRADAVIARLPEAPETTL